MQRNRFHVTEQTGNGLIRRNKEISRIKSHKTKLQTMISARENNVLAIHILFYEFMELHRTIDILGKLARQILIITFK